MPITELLRAGSRWPRWGFAAASVVVHGALLAALVVATEEEPLPPAEEGEEEVTYVDIRRFAPPPPPAATAAEATQPEPEPSQPQPRTQPEPRPQQPPRTPPRATDIVDPVDSLPDEPIGQDVPAPAAPQIDTRVAPVTASAGRGGRPGGVEGGVEGGKVGGVVGGQGEEVPEPGGTYIASVVDRQAELTNRSDLPRLMQRLYPGILRDARIGGRVVVQFVVGTNGRVDMSTVKVMSSTHDAFIGPTREAIGQFRFRPARMGDQSVRMLTQLPIVWEVK